MGWVPCPTETVKSRESHKVTATLTYRRRYSGERRQLQDCSRAKMDMFSEWECDTCRVTATRKQENCTDLGTEESVGIKSVAWWGLSVVAIQGQEKLLRAQKNSLGPEL